MKNQSTGPNKKAHLRLALTTVIAALTSLPLLATDQFRNHDQDDDETHYQQFNLVADTFGIAQLQDTNLVNAWGLAFAPNGPFWIGNNGSGTATLYAVTNDASGVPHVTKNARVVTIPGNGSVTGVINNSTTGFHTNLFIFASGDGTISGWRPALGNAAEVLTIRNTALYTGLALASNNAGPVLLAANFREGTLDEYNASLQLLGRFADRRTPVGYAPFNVQNVAGNVFVTYTKQSANKNDVVIGRGRGLINVFTVANNSFRRFATGKAVGGNSRELNAPWGITLAPATFGSHGDELLVGNFGSGTIMSFNANGRFRGLLKGAEDCPVTIDGLWALAFGGTGSSGVATDLYFTAGPGGETRGLFGVLQKKTETYEND